MAEKLQSDIKQSTIKSDFSLKDTKEYGMHSEKSNFTKHQTKYRNNEQLNQSSVPKGLDLSKHIYKLKLELDGISLRYNYL